MAPITAEEIEALAAAHEMRGWSAHSRHDMLTEAETRYIIRAAAETAIATGKPDHKHYARIYWGMIL